MNPFNAKKGILLTAIVLLAFNASAKNIYKYQDENGIWHFTDRSPSEGQEFETVYMESEPEPRIRMRKEGSDASPVYLIFNDFCRVFDLKRHATHGSRQTACGHRTGNADFALIAS